MPALTPFEQFLQALGLLQGPALASQDIPYAGMDNSFYPGKDFMDYFRANTNVVWTGIYLSATGHGGTDWETAPLQIAPQPPGPLNWGMAPIYLGSQDPANPAKNLPFDLSVARAQSDGDRAVARCGIAQIPVHAVVYFDWETNSPVTPVDKLYVKTWFGRVSEQGYRTGIYCAPGMAAAFRDLWPDAYIWIVRPHRTADALVRPSSQATSTLIAARDPETSGYVDAVLWQFAWPKSEFVHQDRVDKAGKQIDHVPTGFEAWPADVFFPPYAGGYGGIKPAFVQTGPTAGRPRFDIDWNCSSVRDPMFPERAMAPALIRGGRASAAIVDASTLVMFAVRAGGLSPAAWVVAAATAAFVGLPDHSLAFNPWAPHSAVQRGPNGDLAIIARSAIEGTADDAWQIHAFRRRGATWTFDENITGSVVCDPLTGAFTVSRASDTTEVLFADRDTQQLQVVATTDAATQTDGQPWQPPVSVALPTPAIVGPPLFALSRVGGASAVSPTSGALHVFAAGRQTTTGAWQLYWTASALVGEWLVPLSVPGDPTVQLHPFTNVASVSRDMGLIDAFAVARHPADTTWTLFTWLFRPPDGWGVAGSYHTQQIAGSITPHPLCKVRAVSRSPQFIDVFVVGLDDGLLYNAFWDSSTNTWSDFRQVPAPSASMVVARIDAAVSRDANSVDVIVTGRDGNVYISSWNSGLGSWPPLVNISALSVI